MSDLALMSLVGDAAIREWLVARLAELEAERSTGAESGACGVVPAVVA